MKPKISIVIPVYRTENYIARCLESIQNQVFQDYEIIVVDDCSPDKAMKIVEKKALLDKRIKSVYHDKNQGTMIARQTGYETATGEYIMFIDSDDTLPEDALTILYNEITQSAVDIVISGFQFMRDNSHNNEKQYPKIIGEFTPEEYFNFHLDNQMWHTLWNCIFKAELFKYKYVNIPYLTNGEDMMLFFQLIGYSKKIKSIEAITYNYHLEGLSATRSAMNETKLRQFTTVHNFKYNFFHSRGIPDEKIFKSIIPLIVYRFRYPGADKAATNLLPEIKKELGLQSSFKYVNIKSWLIYVVMKRTFICSKIIKLFYHFLR